MKFDSYHPAINFIFFAVVIVCTVYIKHPVFLMISFVSAFIYSVKLKGKKACIFNLLLIPAIVVYALYYSHYNHFGITNIKSNFIGNQITLESIVYGGVLGMIIASVIMWMICVFEIITTDKVIYLFGKISPKLSLFLSILLRSVPRIKERAVKIEKSRQGIGKGIGQGTLVQRMGHLIALISIVITWTLEDFVESAVSMKSRGYSLKGRTAFSIYRFDYRDRSLVLGMFSCMTVIWMAMVLDQTKVLYDPMIVMNPVTPMSYVFYIVYTIFLLFPFGLQLYAEWSFKRSRSK